MGVIDLAATILAVAICVAVALFLFTLLFVTVDENGWRFEAPWRVTRNAHTGAHRAPQHSCYRSRHYRADRAPRGTTLHHRF